MELLAELLLSALGFVAELVLQLVFEVLAEAGVRVLREPFRARREISPFVAGMAYSCYGALCGGLSLWVFPDAWLATPAARLANLVLTPLLAGLVMALIGAWRRRRGDELVRLDRFAYGYVFALAMALVRFVFASPG